MERYHSTFCQGDLEIRGILTTSGPQPVSEDGGVPEFVADIFRKDVSVQTVVISREWVDGMTWKRSVIYRRMDAPAESGEVK